MALPTIGHPTYRFGDCEVHAVERRVLVGGQPVALGSRALDVLLALVERAGRTVGRAELLDAAWPGLVVEENNLSVQIATLRRALGPQVIATIPGLGYRFSATLHADAAPPPAAPAPAAPAAPRRGNVPPFTGGLIAREAEVDAVLTLASAHRLVTITGAGGIGKTRLAQAVAARWPVPLRDGTWMVELAPIADAGLLAAAVAQTLGLRLPGVQAPQDELVEALYDAELLLVLDNCEHLVEAAGRLAQALLAGTPQVRLLATSQELLKLPDEHVHRLPPLPVPASGDSAPAQHGAVQLLVARVSALDPRFVLDRARAEEAAEICRRLDGLPLAIELAAARVPLLGLAGVRAGLDQRFGLLTGGSRAGLRRHRTLRETLEWSHSLLTPGERAAFRRAGVFAGSFGLAQAQQVLGAPGEDPWAVLEHLAGLVDKSLVLVDGTEPPRYRLLESTRAFAWEALREAGECAAVQQRHAEATCALFEQALALEWTLPSQQRLRRFLPDLDNGRAALEATQHADPALHARLAAALAWLFIATGQVAEGLRHVRQALSQGAWPAAVEARLWHELCGLLQGTEGKEPLQAAQRAVALLGGAGLASQRYAALGRLAVTAALSNDAEQAGLAAIAEMETLWDPAWPPLARWELLNARDYVTNLRRDEDRYPAALRLAEGERLAAEQLALARAHGDTGKVLFALMAAEQCTATRGHYEEAVERGRELVALAQQEEYVEKLHIYICNLATALVMCGRAEEALPLARRSSALDLRRGSLWESLDMLAMLALRRGRSAHAARILGCSDAANAWRAAEDGQDFRQEVEVHVRDAVEQGLRQLLDAATLQALMAEGARLPHEQAAALALDDEPPAATSVS